ncbi:MAG: glycosyltransferase [Cytophagales bacterium]|nr:glycosyltransferase [Cytophagales bacterium]
MADLDIIIPVYNEAETISEVLFAIKMHVKTPNCVLICYDKEEDNTLPVVQKLQSEGLALNIKLIKNKGKGAHGAIMTGFENCTASAILVYPGDDYYNAKILDKMYSKMSKGSDIVVASRFMKGGSMQGCPWLKSIFVRTASFTLYTFALIPVRDASNGFRMFSKRVLDNFEIESTQGFTYSIELLVKCHRYGWKISEVPSTWIERDKGTSKFSVSKWLPYYLKWYFYGFQTTFLRRGPETVKLKPNSYLIED